MRFDLETDADGQGRIDFSDDRARMLELHSIGMDAFAELPCLEKGGEATSEWTLLNLGDFLPLLILSRDSSCPRVGIRGWCDGDQQTWTGKWRRALGVRSRVPLIVMYGFLARQSCDVIPTGSYHPGREWMVRGSVAGICVTMY